ncbi:MAG: AAA family ATPase [Bacillota bacterium]
MAHPRTSTRSLIERVADGRLSPGHALHLLADQFERGGRRGTDGADASDEASTPPPDSHSARDGDSLQQAMAELDALVGLHSVKRAVRELRAYVEIRQKRAAAGLAAEPLVLHMAFKGNPGTGKTTVARIIGRMLKALGVLPKGHTVEVERADLVGEFVGHTAQRTREQIRRAIGGVLFIDEAYSLARGGDKDFGKEAVDGLVKAMEDHRHELVVIMAGYRQEMEFFLRLNPGLRSRIPFVIDFPDYNGEELLQIATHMLKARDYRLSPEARERLAAVLMLRRVTEPFHFGNARLVRNILEAAIRLQAVRLHAVPAPTREELMLIRVEDIPFEGALASVPSPVEGA